MAFFFLLMIIGSSDSRAPRALAPVAISLCLKLIHLVNIPVTNTYVIPAQSIWPAIFAGSWAPGQPWRLIVAAIGGGVPRRPCLTVVRGMGEDPGLQEMGTRQHGAVCMLPVEPMSLPLG
jgi:hypothetical protein